MSLITEALKKAETQPPIPREEPPPPPASLWLYRLGLLGCVGIVLLALAQVTRGRQPLRGSQAAAAAQALPATGAEKKPGFALLGAAQSDLVLNGILRGGADGKSLALINNQVVQQGEQFQGMRAVQVNPDSVQIEERNGKMRTLKLAD